MKKSKLFYLMVSCLVALPLNVKADMGSPELVRSKVTPKLKSGATYYEAGCTRELGTINYGEKVTLEYDYNGTYAEAQYKNKSICINTDDFINTDKIFDVNSVELEGETVVLVVGNEDLELRSGPNKIYEVYTKIPVGTTLRVRKIQKADQWYYTEYKGYKGYISSEKGNVAFSKQTVIFPVEKTLYKINNDGKTEKIGSLPARKEYEIYNIDAWTGLYYIENEGYVEKGTDTSYKNTIDSLKLKINGDNLYPIEKGIENPENMNKAYGITYSDEPIKPGTYDILYFGGDYGDDWYTIDVDGETKWIYYGSGHYNMEMIGEMEINGEVEMIGEYDYSEISLPDEIEYIESGQDVIEEKAKSNEISDDKKSSKKDEFLTKKELIIYGGSAIAVIIITTIVTIVIVNKKKVKNS